MFVLDSHACKQQQTYNKDMSLKKYILFKYLKNVMSINAMNGMARP